MKRLILGARVVVVAAIIAGGASTFIKAACAAVWAITAVTDRPCGPLAALACFAIWLFHLASSSFS
tara:strand:- start:684 stop:881 length:198 start_codon:yes stop_codon:yes gene_type:complete